MSREIRNRWRTLALAPVVLVALAVAALVALVALPAWLALPAQGAQTAFDSAAAPAGTELKVLRAVPEGQQVPPPGRQIVITFDRAVVPVGAMSVATAPVITPAVNCQWHWLDPRSLACELNEKQALAAATQYTVTVKAGIRAQDGADLKRPYQWVFTTERPAVKEYSFRTWRSPGTPMVRVVFNQPVTQESVQSALHFADQSAVIASPDPYLSEVFYSLPLPGEPGALFFPGGTPRYKSAARRVWQVEPTQELPLDTTVRLGISPGLRSYAGPLRGTEQRTVVEFDTFPTFRFLGVRCLVDTKSTLIERSSAAQQPACNPFGAVSLVFSAPVIADEIKAHLTLTPDLLAGRTDFDPWANVRSVSRLWSPHTRGGEYTVELPEHLRAFQGYSIADLKGVRDEFGRVLMGPDAMNFRTDHRPPRLKITHPIAVLEKDAHTSMPLFVTNLTDIDVHYRKLTPKGAESGLSGNQAVSRAWDISYAVPAKIRELLDGGTGVLSGSLYPHPAPSSATETLYFDTDADEAPWAPNGSHRDFFAEVTPFEVHVKLGAYNTLVWVTSLADGMPVPEARIRIYRDDYRGLTAAAAVLAEGTTAKDGSAVLAGRDDLARAFGEEPGNTSLMVRVDAHGDLALLPLDSAFELDTYRASRGQFWSGYSSRGNHIRAWGTTAQGVYKLGDVVQYKLYLRNQNNSTLEPVAQRSGYQLDIIDPAGKTVKTETGITLSTFGGYDGSFRVPLSGAVGWYDFRLHIGTGTSAADWTPMHVLIADFTPAPFQVQNTLNGQLFQPGDAVEVATQAALHAGGPYADASSRVTARLFPQAVQISNPIAAGFNFASAEPEGECRGRPWKDVVTVHQSAEPVDDKGRLTTRFQMPDAGMLSARLEVESAVRDERGKYVATRSSAQYRGRDRFVGMRSDHWTFEEGKPATIQYLVVDQDGKPISGVPVTVTASSEIVTAARVKGAGDAYLTSYESRWDGQTSCKGESGDAAQNCTFTPGRPGLYSFSARVDDTHGRPHTTEMCMWVTGKGRVMWEEPADMSLSLVPEKETYKVGEHARYLVKNPFPGARALITIERFGVIKHWVQTLAGNTPVIEFNVEPDFMPGFYLSVVVMSPRVAPVRGAAAIDEDGVDLGRPTYRIGYLKVPVEDPYKTLDVSVKSDKHSYKPREPVTIRVAATPHKSARREPIEFAVVVLDEAVFDLIQDGKSYFDPYRGFYQLENLDLKNYTLLSRLVGLQKFEKKGANSGGDGGAGFDMRSISKYVAYWNPSVPADKHGAAKVTFVLPDNLTGWRVFALAVTPSDRVGLGDYKFKSSKLTELRPVMPNQLTVGDRVTAGFSVLNRSDQTRTIDVELEARGPIEAAAGTNTVKSHQTVTLAPFKRETLWLPFTTIADGSVAVSGVAFDPLDRDALTHTLTVHRRVSLDVAASYGTTLSSGIDEPIMFPAQMLPGIGAVTVSLTPTVLGNLDGALRYVRDYPYLCWEQRLTKAVLAASYLKLRDYLAPDLLWPQAEGLPQSMLDDAASFQAPNGGMSFWVADDARVSPYLSAATALAFNRLISAGYHVPEEVQKNLDTYLERMLRENVAPSFYSEGMVSSVRAVALQALAERNRLSLADLQRYENYASRMDLFGLAAYLNAATRIKGGETLAASLAGQILSHANQSGGQFHFSEMLDNGYLQILSTPMRSECAILSALLEYGGTTEGAKLVGDVPFKLVRSVTQSRGSRDHWENTQENLYCTSALAQYAAAYEKDTPALSARASLDGEPFGDAKFGSRRDPPVLLTHPNGAEAGHRAVVHIERSGEGRLYYSTRLSYSLNDLAAKETNAGLEVHREYSVQRAGRWQLLQSPLQVQRGELLRIDLYLSVPAPRHFVVVDDPVPGGLEPVDRDLATASTVDADETSFSAAGGSFWFKFSDWSEYGISLWNFYHRELRHDAALFYADYLPAGHYHLSYGAQAMAEGQFTAAPAKAEEMYDPDVYGKSLPATLLVGHE
jgi:alpha-2-macroglobulin